MTIADPEPWRDLILVGTSGHVLAVDPTDGHTVWTTSLPDTGYAEVTLACRGERLIAATAGHVFAIDPRDGAILWANTLDGMGFEKVHVAMTPDRVTAATHGGPPAPDPTR